MDPTNRWTLVADLGLDCVFVYRFDVDHGKMMSNPSGVGLQTKPGAGPRQIAFHPNGKFLFVINELNSTMTAASWDAEKGVLKETSTLSTLPPDFQEKNTTAAVHVSRDGKTVYGSNRGHDSIVVFRFDESSGELTKIGYQSTEGNTPRDFKLTPDGRFLLAENQKSDSIVALAIDEKTGMLTATGKRIEVPKPSCIEFLKNSNE
jgi:6-phosphogluconolactonase